jgi:hypothetical protein
VSDIWILEGAAQMKHGIASLISNKHKKVADANSQAPENIINYLVSSKSY